eukprot:TRINITY_DN35849_c0_g1_i1.p1 TRINITY_DN35849_c0_g1~~TRINITY_DN35849_c0_g1_i1.p1  ORF type:complete len:489 (+),score=174.14 TRINITY_DN35849_c0_g1_i1:65-1531(+)
MEELYRQMVASAAAQSLEKSSADDLLPGREEDDNFEQVLVAAFPGAVPDVFVARLHAVTGMLTLREASVERGGEVALGGEKTIDLAQTGPLRISDGVVALLSDKNELLVQMHVDDEQEREYWAQAIKLCQMQRRATSSPKAKDGASGRSSARTSPTAGKAGIANRLSPEAAWAAAKARNTHPSSASGSARTSPKASPKASPQKKVTSQTESEANGDELPMLRARSQQLQTKIGSLEALSHRRDRQLQKLTKRLDGAMQMLGAVQDMCGQQRKVIQAQQQAIIELRQDAGEEDPEEDEDDEEDEAEREAKEKAERMARQRVAASAKPQANGVSHAHEQDDAVAKAEAEMAAKADQMLALLQQADKMQQALAELEAMEAAGGSEEALRQRSDEVMRNLGIQAQALEEDEEEGDNDGEEEDDEASEADQQKETEEAMNRLRSLEQEKSRFEGMLESSQNEHEELLQQLEGMRNLMASLGMNIEDLDDEAGA